MDQFILGKSDFGGFFDALKAYGKVFAPRPVSDQSFAYKPVSRPQDISFDALRTILPAKKFFYPQQEDLVRFENGSVVDVVPEVEPQAVFGVHPCELAGIAVLDTIFGAEPADNHYRLRRQVTLLVGTSCTPDKYCFCKSTGTDMPDSAYDIFLTDIGDAFLVQARTELGRNVLADVSSVKQPDAVHTQKFHNFYQERDKSFASCFDGADLKVTLDNTGESPTWQEMGERCLSCGNCTPVCPTCYCFDLVDIAQLNGDATRRREWDSCQFSGFAAVAGGFNFRPTPVERLKFWYRHKLYGFEDPYGMPTCIGCGRCTVSCPAGIDDIVGLVKQLQAEQAQPSQEAGADHVR
jgi:sulfhydrogenase subunit beta (sulfur reductase)